jgi:hypothetical protein
MRKVPDTKVVNIEEDGLTMRVEFKRRNGEVVVGIYVLRGWAIPPAVEREEFRKIITSAPLAIYRGA